MRISDWSSDVCSSDLVLAEVIGMEVRAFGIDTIIIVPGAFTAGTEHFVHAVGPACPTIVTQYGELAARAETLGERLDEIDNANGGSLNVTAVGDAFRDALEKPVGKRPYRIFVDGQKKGVEEILAIKNARDRKSTRMN